MPTIYRFDSANVWTGESQEISIMDGAPPGWTFETLPDIPEGKFAYFSGPDWIIIDAYPSGFGSSPEVLGPSSETSSITPVTPTVL